MHRLRGDFRQRLQHEGITGDFGPGQANTFNRADQRIIGKDIDIQSAGTELECITAASMGQLDFAQLPCQCTDT